MSENEAQTPYEQVGGMPTFERLAAAFYQGVETDAELRALYPKDLGPAEKHMALFLAQYWGGPTTYSDSRGHPRLRMRHMPFRIGKRERDSWLKHMLNAIDAVGIEEPVRSEMREYFDGAATFLINQDDSLLRR